VLVAHPADELGQVRLDITQRQNSHIQKYDVKRKSLGVVKNLGIKHKQKAGSLFGSGLLALVAGVGFEPTTSGL
jgi:hypothetical protein